MKLGVAITGYIFAALLSLAAATIQVLQLNAVNAPLVIGAITLLVVAIAAHALGVKGEAPPTA